MTKIASSTSERSRKGFFPGLRLGWIVAPPDVFDALSRAKLISDYHTSLLLQAAVLTFCRRGHYDAHLERLARIYRDKSRTLIAALERYFPEGVTWTEPEGGFAFWITLPASESADAVLAEAKNDGVVFTPGTHFLLGAKDNAISACRFHESRSRGSKRV